MDFEELSDLSYMLWFYVIIKSFDLSGLNASMVMSINEKVVELFMEP